MPYLEKLANQNHHPSLVEIVPLKSKYLNYERMKAVFFNPKEMEKTEVVGKKNFEPNYHNQNL